MDEIELYIDAALDSFDNDPPDSDYQRGYLAAIVNMNDFLLSEEK